jgi:hypothetical protein
MYDVKCEKPSYPGFIPLRWQYQVSIEWAVVRSAPFSNDPLIYKHETPSGLFHLSLVFSLKIKRLKD